MTVRKVVSKTEKSLLPVRQVTKRTNRKYLQTTISDLQDTLKHIQETENVGVGLAANQIEYPYAPISKSNRKTKPGYYPRSFKPLNVYVVSVTPERAEKESCDPVLPSVFINASYEPIGKEVKIGPEGCLSVWGFRGTVVGRFQKIKVSAQNEKGENIIFEAEGFSARIHQHEIDHGKGAEYLNQLNFSKAELQKILEWIASYRRNPSRAADEVVPGKLVASDRNHLDVDALRVWTIHALKNIPQSTGRNPCGIFSGKKDKDTVERSLVLRH